MTLTIKKYLSDNEDEDGDWKDVGDIDDEYSVDDDSIDDDSMDDNKNENKTENEKNDKNEKNKDEMIETNDNNDIINTINTLMSKESFLKYQIEIIIKLQQNTIQTSSSISKIASMISLIGSGKVILIVLCLIYWLGDASLGLLWQPSNAATHMLIICGIIKSFIKGPRPYLIDERIKTLDPTKEESYGFPSGHTSGVISIYGLIACFYCDQNTYLSMGWMIYLNLCLLVSISRIYTGAHFISDVIGGIVLGMFLLWNELRKSGIELMGDIGRDIGRDIGMDVKSDIVIDENMIKKNIINMDLNEFTQNPQFTQLQYQSHHHHISESLYLICISIICFIVIYLCSRNKENEMNLKLNQESICGCGFGIGLAICHLLETFIHETQMSMMKTSLSLMNSVMGMMGIIVIDQIRKKYEGKRKEMKVKEIMMISMFYSMVMIWSLWMVPYLFSVH